jgi:hypothetical protein
LKDDHGRSGARRGVPGAIAEPHRFAGRGRRIQNVGANFVFRQPNEASRDHNLLLDIVCQRLSRDHGFVHRWRLAPNPKRG